ncbi:MAG: hypothetical protein KJ600_02375 [Nanoarchaeota archaeon]|nr:hypothetical protein [Nanoarchaeota archaeon]MBU1103380.1 hypothetical protein [Nanoarchaeota archaeon]
MVNEKVVNYLVEGKKKGFSIQLLKKKLLEGGFNENDVDEAIAVVEKKQVVQQPLQSPALQTAKPQQGVNSISQSVGINKAGAGGIKWIKIAGIVGIVLLILNIFLTTLNFAAKSFVNSLLANQIIFLIFLVVFILLFFFYYFGFVKVGKFVGEKFLKLGAWFIIIFMFLCIVLIIVAGIVVFPQAVSASVDGSLESFKTVFLILGVSSVILWMLVVIGYLLFSIGLIKAGRQVRFAKVAGILNICVFVAGIAFIVGMIILIYSLLNAFSVGMGVIALSGIETVASLAVYSAIGIYVLWMVSSVFGILALFDASKKFEVQ